MDLIQSTDHIEFCPYENEAVGDRRMQPIQTVQWGNIEKIPFPPKKKKKIKLDITQAYKTTELYEQHKITYGIYSE